MSSIGNITFKGESDEYKFKVYKFDSSWNSVSVVYITTKRTKTDDDGYTHSVIYVGQTGDLKDRFSDHHKEKCFVEKDPNCLCLLMEKDEEKRLSIESDLIDNYNPPCNG